KPLKLDEVKKLMDQGVVLLDTRDTEEAKKGIPQKAICISLGGSYAVWAGALIKPGTKLVLITAEGKEKESIYRLARVGYDSVVGYLEGGFDTWVKEGGSVEDYRAITPKDLKN